MGSTSFEAVPIEQQPASVYSFASGPAAVPRCVLEVIGRDLARWRGGPLSALELPFTGDDFAAILFEAEQDLRRLLNLSDNYRVLFLQGGALAQFAAVPMNLMRRGAAADYVETGYWSRRAIDEAAPWVRVRLAARGDGRSLPAPQAWSLSDDAAYCHYTSNETADGLQYHAAPDTGPVPLVADMSADFLVRPFPVARFGLIYASAQKNLAAAGLTVVVVREDLLGEARAGTPAPLDYTRQSRARSKVNTPPTFSITVAAHMLRWLVETGGLDGAAARSRRRSEKVYAVIGDGDFYSSPVARPDRSCVSVRFHLPDPALEAMFIDEATAEGLLHLAGHPAVGGLRASLYNGISDAAVDSLVGFMVDFRRRRG